MAKPKKETKTTEQIVEPIKIKAEETKEVAKALIIKTDEQYQAAGDEVKSINKRIKEAKALLETITKPLNQALRSARALFKVPLDLLEEAKKDYSGAMLKYYQEQERKKREEDERLRKEAEKEAARQKALAEKRAKTQEKKGNAEAAEEIRTEAEEIHIPAPVSTRTAPKVAGITKRVTWSGKVTNKMALIKAVASGQAPANLLDVNQTVLNTLARGLRDELNYPGVEAVKNEGIGGCR